MKVAMTYWSLTVSAGILVTLTSQTYIYSSIWRAFRRETLSNRESMRPLWFFHLYIYIYIYIYIFFFFFRKVTIDCQSDTSVSHLHFTYCAWFSCICFISLILIELIINCCFSFFYRKTDPDRVNNKSYSKETELKDF